MPVREHVPEHESSGAAEQRQHAALDQMLTEQTCARRAECQAQR